MSLTLTQLEAHAAKALQQAVVPVTLAYAWPHDRNGEGKITVNGKTLPVYYCNSHLEIREALSQPETEARVLLVGVPEQELGQDALARFFKQRLLHVDRWQLIQDVYDVRQIDPRLYSLSWLPEMLLSLTPTQRRSAAAVLTYDRAIEICLASILELGVESLDLEGLLLACLRGMPRWLKLKDDLRKLFQDYAVARLGALAEALLMTSAAGNGHAVLGIGLVCEVLFAPESERNLKLRDARIRLEQRLGGYRLKEAEGKQWADLAKKVFYARSCSLRQEDSQLAVDLLADIDGSEFVGLSVVLPEAFDARLEVLAKALNRYLNSAVELDGVEAAVKKVLEHEHPPKNHPGRECAQMVARLCRYETVLGSAELITDTVGDYLDHGAWEDWARRTLRGVQPAALARTVTKMLDRISARRLAADEAFATAVAEATAIGQVPAGVMPIEDALHSLVTPLARDNPVLLIVLDGMSQDVYLAIAQSLMQRHWVSWSKAGSPRALLATIPSITEYSRMSLLAGRLARGAASDEKQAFSQHEGLRRASKMTKPPLILHKAALEQSHQLTEDASMAIADSNQHVVAVVINAIDDALARSEQIRIDWSIETIPLLAEVLELARRAERAVVITSDHGHVLERVSVLRQGGQGERWRLPGRAPEEGEVAVSGPRVQALTGDLIVPWSEALRYAPKKNGYHGGLSRQEMLVPIGIWTSGAPPHSKEGGEYVADYRSAPSWWDLNTDLTAVPVNKLESIVKNNEQPDLIDDLFSVTSSDNWLPALMNSALLQRQRERLGKMVLDHERLYILLDTLRQQGGRCSFEQLAAAIGQPALRMRGVVTMMERMLNVDGFPVITLEQESNTVLLDVALLKAQFLT